jgi:hypothetical protein
MLSKADREIQMGVMRTWFFQRYEDPQEECPYDSEEGDYVYIWGGPYDAREELQGEFDGVVPQETIDALAEELERDCVEWSAVPEHADVDDYFADAIGSTENPYGNLRTALDSLAQLSNTNVQGHLQQKMLQMVYVSAVTALEAYLSEFFVREVSNDTEKLRRFVESNPDFKKRTFALSELFSKADSIKETVREYLADLLWHNLAKVKPMFKSSLGIDFAGSLDKLIEAIRVRHDLVHRGGKTKSGEQITIDKPQVEGLLQMVLAFADHIEAANLMPDF